MRTLILGLMLAASSAGRAEPRAITLVPESLNEGCASSWTTTETEERTSVRFQGLTLDLSSGAAAEIKHCRIAWKPLIPAGCYAPSARLEIHGDFRKDASPSHKLRAQLRLSHDLLGQGDSSVFKNVELEEGPFHVTLELPPERFESRWDQVKIITHFSLFLRLVQQEPNSNPQRLARTSGRVSIDSLDLSVLRSRDCPPVAPR